MDVLLVDDHPTVLETLGAVTRRAFNDVHIRTASTLSEALQQARDAERLDLVLLDLGLPGCSGIDSLLRFRTEFPSIRVLVVSAEEDPQRVTAALEAGAAGYVPKRFTPAAIAAAIRLVAEGGTYIPPGALEPARPAAADRTLLGLTEREYAVLRLVAQGMNNKDIARELDIAEGTVKQHLQNLFRTLGVSSRVEALVLAARRGFRLD
jgi:DNA-binding NarL/FixJ family response regulator